MRADGVFAGGGVKGMAFTGALQAAADAGYDEWGSTLHFALDADQKQFLYDAGYQAAKRFFASNPKATNTYGATPP